MNELDSIMAELTPVMRSAFSFSENIFSLWFSDLKLISLDDTEAVFLTPSKLRCNILSSKYADKMAACLAEVIGFEVKVTVKTDESETDGFASGPAIEPHPVQEKEKDPEKEAKITTLLSGNPKKTVQEEYTFENFIEGESNKFARAACLAVANEPTTYNPLFIYGNSGLGKTHLLYAVINELRTHHPNLKIVYRRCEDFLNELISALSDKTTAAFKERYRTADVLLIDDIQFISGKESTQEEFFNTFSTLYESDKQIILTSDRPPKDITPLEDRLRTRFESGLLADVQPPSYELRCAIVKKKAETVSLPLTNEQVSYIAERLHKDVRQIEGTVKRLSAIRSIYGDDVTKETIDGVIAEIDPGNIPSSVLVERIMTVVAKKYGVSVDDLTSKKKTEDIANARHVAVYLARQMTSLSLNAIGASFNRHHSTIMASIDQIEVERKTVKNLDQEIKALVKEINGQKL